MAAGILGWAIHERVAASTRCARRGVSGAAGRRMHAPIIIAPTEGFMALLCPCDRPCTGTCHLERPDGQTEPGSLTGASSDLEALCDAVEEEDAPVIRPRQWRSRPALESHVAHLRTRAYARVQHTRRDHIEVEGRGVALAPPRARMRMAVAAPRACASPTQGSSPPRTPARVASGALAGGRCHPEPAAASRRR